MPISRLEDEKLAEAEASTRVAVGLSMGAVGDAVGSAVGVGKSIGVDVAGGGGVGDAPRNQQHHSQEEPDAGFVFHFVFQTFCIIRADFF